jgi:hypothetical protein
VGTDATIVEYLDLLTLINIALVGNSIRVFLPIEVRRRMTAIAKGFVPRLPASAQCGLGLNWKLLTEPVRDVFYVRDDVWSVRFDSYLRVDIRSSCGIATFHRSPPVFLALLNDLDLARI